MRHAICVYNSSRNVQRVLIMHSPITMLSRHSEAVHKHSVHQSNPFASSTEVAALSLTPSAWFTLRAPYSLFSLSTTCRSLSTLRLWVPQIDRCPLTPAYTNDPTSLPQSMASSEPNGHNAGTIDLPIIDITELNNDTGKQVLDAFVSVPSCEAASGFAQLVQRT